MHSKQSIVDCLERKCEDDCSGHGLCTVDYHCECFGNYSGRVCSNLDCDNGCTGHGTCLNGTCDCGAPWGGARRPTAARACRSSGRRRAPG